MLSIGVLGINFKTAGVCLREVVARAAFHLSGEQAIFQYPVVVLSTCNRTEIYFSADDLALAHSDLLAYLRNQIQEPFEHRLYSYFGIDCFVHLCRVAAGLDSAIVAETEIQHQVKIAYARGKFLPSCLHYVFQKALKVGKLVRNRWEIKATRPTLYGTLWQLAEWRKRRSLLVGYSEINRGLISFLMHKEVKHLSLCTRVPSAVKLEGISVYGREELHQWQKYEIIVCASQAEDYLIAGQGESSHRIFDLSVPRNVDPEVGKSAILYNVDQLVGQKAAAQNLRRCESLIWKEVIKLTQIYRLKIRHALETAGMQSHL